MGKKDNKEENLQIKNSNISNDSEKKSLSSIGKKDKYFDK
jgi:hypothetical protein